MENAYGIGVTNRYALFLDEDAEDVDPLDILKQSEVEKTKNKKVTVAKDASKGQVKKTEAAPKKDSRDGGKAENLYINFPRPPFSRFLCIITFYGK